MNASLLPSQEYLDGQPNTDVQTTMWQRKYTVHEGVGKLTIQGVPALEALKQSVEYIAEPPTVTDTTGTIENSSRLAPYVTGQMLNQDPKEISAHIQLLHEQAEQQKRNQ